MEISTIFNTSATVIIAAFGWIVVHRHNTIRDRSLKRRQIITSHLIDAYKFLADSIVHRQISRDIDRKLELVITELQLFGNLEQAELASKLAHDIKKGGDFNVDHLLNSLRESLRKELGLQPIAGNVTWLRLDRKK